jgi:hypothetical protein
MDDGIRRRLLRFRARRLRHQPRRGCTAKLQKGPTTRLSIWRTFLHSIHPFWLALSFRIIELKAPPRN